MHFGVGQERSRATRCAGLFLKTGSRGQSVYLDHCLHSIREQATRSVINNDQHIWAALVMYSPDIHRGTAAHRREQVQITSAEGV
jgi:hypothetical protein